MRLSCNVLPASRRQAFDSAGREQAIPQLDRGHSLAGVQPFDRPGALPAGRRQHFGAHAAGWKARVPGRADFPVRRAFTRIELMVVIAILARMLLLAFGSESFGEANIP